MKAWDKIRETAKAPIGQGQWQPRESDQVVGPCVEVWDILPPQVSIVIGNGTLCLYEPAGLRQIAEFLNELANQLDSAQ